MPNELPIVNHRLSILDFRLEARCSIENRQSSIDNIVMQSSRVGARWRGGTPQDELVASYTAPR